VRIEWHTAKAAANLTKHGVSFWEAASIFGDPLSTTVSDPEPRGGEERLLTTGMSSRGRLLIVWQTEDRAVIRIIGARRATAREGRTYESRE
jgi:uncharacterized DUF497 family protein